jgi:large subunit ribosomal protein L31
MKADIHPAYEVSQLPAAAATSSKLVRPVQALAIDVCNECHPFYTGKQKTLDTGGRVQRSPTALVLSARSLLLLQQSGKAFGLLPADEKGVPCGRLFCADLAVRPGQAFCPAPATLARVAVQRVVDGDTVRLRMAAVCG